MNLKSPVSMSKLSILMLIYFLILTLVPSRLLGQAPQQKVSLLGAPWITSLAGAGDLNPGYSGDGGPASLALLYGDYGVAVDASGNVYIADSNNYVIRVVNTQSSAITVAGITIQPGDIVTVAGTGVAGNSGDSGPATSAQINFVGGIAVDSSGNIYIADQGSSYVRKIDNSGTITAFAGSARGGCDSSYSNGANGDGGAATSANFPCLWRRRG
jgi:hypothetical protein